MINCVLYCSVADMAQGWYVSTAPAEQKGCPMKLLFNFLLQPRSRTIFFFFFDNTKRRISPWPRVRVEGNGLCAAICFEQAAHPQYRKTLKVQERTEGQHTESKACCTSYDPICVRAQEKNKAIVTKINLL